MSTVDRLAGRGYLAAVDALTGGDVSGARKIGCGAGWLILHHSLTQTEGLKLRKCHTVGNSEAGIPQPIGRVSPR